MPTDSSNSVNVSREKISLAEVSNTEKQLWACMHSKGVVHNDGRDLYHKACCLYEKLFLNDNELPELQNVEYLLWRLHYKFIDEFRKRISQSSVKRDKLATTKQTKKASNDTHVEGFRSFLSEASKFYQDLIRKIKRFYGLFNEPWFYKIDRVSGRIEHTKMHKCQFVSHRLSICLGDLARYQELCEKPNSQQRNWCVSASYYLEAAKIYPDGGNPQNQLAVLATYIGDDFLALYHCIRSLAVKEPFQDALQNLMLLFERNRSIDTICQSNEMYDFCKPSEWISIPNKAEVSNGIFLNNGTRDVSELHTPSDNVWTLIIKTTSFFFLESSLESFPSTFISTLKELEALLAQDVTKLSSALESYQNMNLSKAGPYRALQIISILLFIIHNLTEDSERKILKPKNETQQSMLINLAWTVTFTFMGRFVDRCLMGSPVIYFPLLPALLVFVEWLVGAVDSDINDEKCESARSYFFGSFATLLNHLQENRAHISFPDHIALWEDYELRGFIPSSKTQESLDFSSHWEEEINYKMKNEYRAHRIVLAAIKIAKRSGVSRRNWLLYDYQHRSFSIMKEKDSERTPVVEEEEDIVFKPIIRHNSEPIQLKNEPETEASDELLQRASSLLIAQNQASINTLISSSPDIPPSSSKQPAQNERPIAAGPPSLSSWVLNGETSSSPRTKRRDAYRNLLKQVEEVDSDELLRSLSLSTNDSSGSVSPMACLSSCSAPSPSAPLYPSNTVWFINTTTQPASTVSSSTGLNFSSPFNLDIPQLATPSFPSFIDHYSSWGAAHVPMGGMQDHRYIESRAFNGVHGSGTSDFGLFDPWGSSATVYMEAGPPLFLPSSSLLHGLQNNQQRPRPYASPGLVGSRPEPQPLLQYLKERDWQLQKESPFTGSPYMQN